MVAPLAAPGRECSTAGPMRELSYDPGRLWRGGHRPIRPLGPMQYEVAGNDEPSYFVNLELDTPCDCRDAQIRGRPCLHELAARLQMGEEGLVLAFGEMLAARQRASGDEDETVEDEAQRGRHGEP